MIRFFIFCAYVVAALSLNACESFQRGPHEPHDPTKLPMMMNPRSSCAQGFARQGYLQPMATATTPCTMGTQNCVGGLWEGPMLYDGCNTFENTQKTCAGAPYGSVVTGYTQPTAPKGTICLQATKTCIDGVWVGPEIFPNCTQVQ